MTTNQCSFCSQPVRYLRKGFCGACYARFQRNGTPQYEQVNRRTAQTACNYCSKETRKLVTGLCRACYYRKRNTGALEYQGGRKLCSAPNCNNAIHGHGLCGKHLSRVLKTGTVSDPFRRGAKTTHPLYGNWSWMGRRAKKGIGRDDRWQNFWNFVDDVGSAPSACHRLYRKQPDKPYGPNNFVWKERILDEIESLDRADYQRAWRRAYEIKNPRYFKNQYLKRYGITIDQYEQMLAVQNNLCAICKQPEQSDHPTQGKFALAVDHCHVTNNVRGLLCSNCNRTLGLMRDAPNLLRAAAEYLEFHKSRFACEPS